MINRFLQLLVLSALLGGLVSAAGAAVPFPGNPPDKRLVKAQQMADELFEQGQYKRAMTIYRNDLAPVGNKYAQYMVGYMYLAGKGVPEDPILASAWYRLAADRGEESLVGERDSLLQYFEESHKAISDRLYADLRRELGDVALISRLIADDLELLRQPSRIDPKRQLATFKGTDFENNARSVKKLRRQIESRMKYLSELANADNTVSVEEMQEISRLKDEVAEALDSAHSQR